MEHGSEVISPTGIHFNIFPILKTRGLPPLEKVTNPKNL